MKRGLLVLVWVVLMVVPLMAQEKVIVTNEWPPYAGDSLSNKGFTAEIIQGAFKKVGIDCDIRFLPWSEALENTKDGKYDAIFNGYYNKDRERFFFYSDTYTTGLLGLYRRKGDNITYEKMEDLKPYKIGMPKGYTISPDFDNATYLNKVEYVGEETECLEKLLAGEVDLIAGDYAVINYLLNQKADGKDAAVKVDPPLNLSPLFILFPKAKPESEQLRNSFNKGLEMMKIDGSLDAVLKLYGLK